MPLLIVTYAPNKEGHDYSALLTTLAAMDSHPVALNVWMVKTKLSIEQLRDRLAPLLLPKDRMFICTTRAVLAHNTSDAAEWAKKRWPEDDGFRIVNSR